MEQLGGGSLSSTGHSHGARGAPAALSKSGSGARREAGALPRSQAASFLRSLSPQLPQINQQPLSTSGSGHAAPAALASLTRAGGRAPAASYVPAELGWALHASWASPSARPCAPHA